MIFEKGIQDIGKMTKAVPRNKRAVVRTGYAKVLKQEAESLRLIPHVLVGGIREN